ncbi:hypothetical protein BIW11_06654 [Tropilaelaps mercedesae]|uniref:Uncharacterized protein n=1 Tax=Tropilaelaps mercedesae TaxID=418985 RepID=A0A1V9XX37_9ACAR|nr:hypothetical protein BIW11_06654 [Tropilaelaps mercedesae]
MINDVDAQVAIEALNGHEYRGVTIFVEESRSRIRHQPGMGGRMTCFRFERLSTGAYDSRGSGYSELRYKRASLIGGAPSIQRWASRSICERKSDEYGHAPRKEYSAYGSDDFDQRNLSRNKNVRGDQWTKGEGHRGGRDRKHWRGYETRKSPAYKNSPDMRQGASRYRYY